jgi:histidyl-tRNA synthetase
MCLLLLKNKPNTMAEIPGFPELLPCDEIIMQNVMEKIRQVYQKYGYVPLDTRLVEYADLLQEKGIDGKEVYALARLHDNEIDMGKKSRILALRFDLTVPLARYVLHHAHELYFPFKRYQIQKVYRGETAKESQGRFREFYQSDIDVIGSNRLDIHYDCEFPSVIYEIFSRVLHVPDFVIRINNRKFLEGLFLEMGIAQENIKRTIKIIDNMEKEDRNETLKSLGTPKADTLLHFFTLCRSSDPEMVVTALSTISSKNKMLQEGIVELREVIQGVLGLGVPKKYIRVDPGIARGLDYYTGTVYETTLDSAPELGSVCSGGRYDNLVGTLSKNTVLYPGCGISIGLSRLVPFLIKRGVLGSNRCVTTAPVLVTTQDPTCMHDYQEIAAMLRQANIACTMYYNQDKLKKQLKYASDCGYSFAIIANKDEIVNHVVNVKNLHTTVQETVPISELPQKIMSTRPASSPPVADHSYTFPASRDTSVEKLQTLLSFLLGDSHK